MHKIRILLVDDHTLMRTGVRMVLQAEPDMEVVGEAASGDEGVRMAIDLRPDVVLMDLSMPGIGGLEATRRIAAADTGARVLVLTVHGEEEYLMPVLEAGGSGYVTKHSADTDLVEALRVVARGDVFLYPSAATVLTRTLRTPRGAHAQDDPVHLLSPREREVLTLTAGGYSSTEIGDRLHLSHKTVETYRQRLMDKLNLHHRSELVRFALARGLLQAATAA
ncbi:MAG TPA: response regulator transcription factor [Longimicrobium sp.]|nr:response regulator transcription factor [Longimicrobium sp.]